MLFKRFKHNYPEEMRIEKFENIEQESFEIKPKDLDFIKETIVKTLSKRSYSIVEYIIENAKTDENFFEEFIGFLKRNYSRQEIIQIAIRNILLEECKKLFDCTSKFS